MVYTFHGARIPHYARLSDPLLHMKVAISPLEQHPILADDAAKEIPLKGKAVIRQQHMNPGFNICSLTEKLPHTNGIRQAICRPFALCCSWPEYLFSR